MDKFYMVCLVVGLILTGCHNEPLDCLEQDCQGLSSILTSNCWQEQEPGSSFAGTNHYFCFREDQSFTLTLEQWADFGNLAGCPNSRTEYVKGNYEVRSNAILVTGEFYDESFEIQVTACGDQGSYDRRFDIVSIQGWEILLRSDDEVDPDIRLTPAAP